MKKSLLVLFLAGAALAGPAIIARVDLAPDRTAQDVARAGFPVVHETDGWCLVRVTESDLPALAAAGGATVLDAETAGRMFFFAYTRPGFDRSALRACGTVLTGDDRGVLLATTESGLVELNRLPVELYSIPREPLTWGEPEPPAPHPVSDSLVWELVNRVSEDSVLATIRRLQNFYTRYSTHDSCRAAVEWVRQRFEMYGCDSTALENWRSNYAPNVIGAKFGRTNRRPIYVICGHTDATSNQVPNRCPGSDDNGSGTTAVLEACRVFADVEFANTVYFIGFTGEEQGLWGSDSFCARAARRGDSIKAALNFDMISYGRQNRDSLEVLGKSSNPACAWLVDAFIANGDTFSDLRTHRVIQSNPSANSDHYSFLKRGWPALMGIECDFTPMYHTIGDTIGTLYYTNCGTNNWLLATRTTRAAVATIAKLAGAYIPTGIEEGVRPVPPAELIEARPSLGPAPIALRFSSPARPGARVEVYDATGRSVGTLDASARQELSWPGRDGAGRRLASGIYLFRLVDGDRTSTARAIVTQ